MKCMPITVKGTTMYQEKKMMWRQRKEYKGIHIITVPTFEKKSPNASYIPYWRPYMRCFSTMMSFIITHQDHAAMLWLPRLFRYSYSSNDSRTGQPEIQVGRICFQILCSLGKEWLPNMLMNWIVLSEGNRKYFKDMYGRNATLIPNGVEKPELKEAKLIPGKIRTQKEELYPVLARIVPEKGLLPSDWSL